MKHNNRSRKPQRSGMTLIEIMVVLVILVTVMTLAVGAFMGQRDRANRLNTYNYIMVLRDAAERYSYDVNQAPPDLIALLQAPDEIPNPASWAGPYIRESATSVDVWGNPFQYRRPGNDGRPFDIWSFGPDGMDGTGDEIGSWEPASNYR